MPKFAHIRLNNPDGSIACRGGITVAYTEDPRPDNGYLYALAFCHEHDNYNKKIGRAKAGGRMKSPAHMQWCSARNTGELISHILEHIPVRWVHHDSSC